MVPFERIKVEEVGDVTIVRFRDRRLGNILEIEKLGQEFYKVIEGGKRRQVLIDFTGVEFFSSAGFGKLLSLNAKLKAVGGTLRLFNIPPGVLEVFHICKLEQIFDIRKDEADALSGFYVG
jgi:anti-sigma B factor antagonist